MSGKNVFKRLICVCIVSVLLIPGMMYAQFAMNRLAPIPASPRCFLLHSSGCLFTGTVHGIYRSCDDGVSWNVVSDTGYITCVTEDRNKNVLATTKGWLIRSTDLGTHWDTLKTTNKARLHNYISVDQHNNYIICIDDLGIRRSTNEGDTWQYITPELQPKITSFGLIGSDAAGNLYIARQWLPGFYRSTDNGLQWNEIPVEYYYDSFSNFVSTPSVTAVAEYRIYISTDNGISWDAADVEPSLRTLARYSICGYKDSILFAARGVLNPITEPLVYGCILRSNDRGLTWSPILKNEYFSYWMTDMQVSSAGYIYLLAGDTLYRSTVPADTVQALPSDTGASVSGVVHGLFVGEMYPNPVSVGQSAFVEYLLTATERISLSLYNVLGEQLRDAEYFRTEDSYIEEIPTSGLSPGVYWYTLRAGQNTATRLLVVR